MQEIQCPAQPARPILPARGGWQPQLPIIQFADSIEAGLEVQLLLCSSVFSSSMEWETQCSSSTIHSPISQSSLVSDLKVSPSKWSCLHCGFAADYLQCRQCHTRKDGPSSGSNNTGLIILSRAHFLLDTYVLFWMGEDAFVAPCFHPSENRATCYSTYR